MEHDCQMMDKFGQHDLELGKLNTTVFTGNGVPPLTTRVSVLEVEMQNSKALRLSVWISVLGSVLNVITGIVLFKIGVH